MLKYNSKVHFQQGELMDTYEKMAMEILKTRKKKIEEKSRLQIAKIKSDFLEYAYFGNFKNIIALIMEYHSVYTDPTNPKQSLKMLFGVNGVSVYVAYNSDQTENRIVNFQNVFGYTIQFFAYFDSEIFHCEISRNGEKVIDTHTDLIEGHLAELVANHFEELLTVNL